MKSRLAIFTHAIRGAEGDLDVHRTSRSCTTCAAEFPRRTVYRRELGANKRGRPASLVGVRRSDGFAKGVIGLWDYAPGTTTGSTRGEMVTGATVTIYGICHVAGDALGDGNGRALAKMATSSFK